ncbi:60 kDa SS-A/Ro ribonucleoprotein [Haloferula luteola]|uniref:60 kDa SS-A/Ro ribonucleoprotein n=1 Tax=Haloferula luteola TaxID=595692 RepID=A0A840VC44_9BACT|nr:RNA-binding protein [Haloferula luteola]MBB5350441.1 60 kDa SS-A/Ro ribonucleoprotein [Haloferula luteola]
MANHQLFRSLRGAFIPKATARNDAGGVAYELSAKAALARVAMTGCLTTTYYVSAETQLERVLELAAKVDTDFLAKTALHARQRGFMKDLPALLCAVLATRDLDRLAEVFPHVIDNGRMLRTFVQILRSGVTGRKSLGSAPRRLVREWLERATDRQLLHASVGNDPSLADIVKMVHPRPSTQSREAFYGWLIGRSYDVELLPENIRHFEDWKRSRRGELPDVPFQMLTALELGPCEWSEIAENASWQTVRMNLNTFARHGVFEDREMVKRLARKLANAEAVRRARVFPYQLMVAFLHAGNEVPHRLREALQDAMEVALENVPTIRGSVVVCPDVSGSMQCAATGVRKGATSKVRCVDIAGLVAAAFLRKNRSARVLPFERDVVEVPLNPRDTVLTNAQRLAAVGGGGTNVSAPLRWLNQRGEAPDLVVFVSDNESWMDARRAGYGTGMLAEWQKLKRRNSQAKLVCIDLVPNTTAQAPDGQDILNVGGFSDHVFEVIAAFAASGSEISPWIQAIESQALNPRLKTA